MSEQVAAQGLDCDLETFRDDLQKASELVIRLYGGLDEARITPAKNRVEIASLFDEPLPEAPQPMEAILREVEKQHLCKFHALSEPAVLRLYQLRGKSGVGSGRVDRDCARALRTLNVYRGL